MILDSDNFLNMINLLICAITMNWFLGDKLEFKKSICKANRLIGAIVTIIITTYILWQGLNRFNAIMATEIITLIPSFIYLSIYKKGSIWEKLYLLSTYVILISTINILFGNAYFVLVKLGVIESLNYIIITSNFIRTFKVLVYLIGLITFSSVFKYIKLKDNSMLKLITISNICMAFTSNVLMNRFIISQRHIWVESFFVAITVLFSHFLMIIILNISYEKSQKLIIAECNLNKLEADLKRNEEIRTIYNEITQWKHDWQNHLNIAMYMLRERRVEEVYIFK
ncbi:Uncharacterised protein [uncultured Clostridium sp.]|uniref:hypothetical protein n=1 Tax=uncultured Clostridium sp. TaxID=59620 RepID=UPI000822B0A2|nr:hypothetical protein [uncultured Clostridium sp.]SCJ93488.1 Uncharacterised protein [uncultured Clostridium sp.]